MSNLDPMRGSRDPKTRNAASSVTSAAILKRKSVEERGPKSAPTRDAVGRGGVRRRLVWGALSRVNRPRSDLVYRSPRLPRTLEAPLPHNVDGAQALSRSVAPGSGHRRGHPADFRALSGLVSWPEPHSPDFPPQPRSGVNRTDSRVPRSPVDDPKIAPEHPTVAAGEFHAMAIAVSPAPMPVKK